MIEKVEGIVLDERKYGETSKIIQVFTKEYGIIGVLAKGASTMKSKLRGVTGKLTYGVFQLYYKENKLSTLVGVDIIDSLSSIRTDITKISYATFLSELVSQVLKHEPAPEIYAIFIAALKKIDEGLDASVITNIVELKCLEFLGVKPVVDACSVCGSKTGIATVSSYKGGYVCQNCLGGEKIVDQKTIGLLRMFFYVDISKIERLDIQPQNKKELDQFIDDYYDRYTGLYVKSKSFLQNLKKLI